MNYQCFGHCNFLFPNKQQNKIQGFQINGMDGKKFDSDWTSCSIKRHEILTVPTPSPTNRLYHFFLIKLIYFLADYKYTDFSKNVFIISHQT